MFTTMDKRKRGYQTPANLLKPKELWADNIAGHHDPIGPAVGAAETIDECIAFILDTGIPRDE